MITYPKTPATKHDLQMAAQLCSDYSEMCKRAGGVGATLAEFYDWLKVAEEDANA